MEREYHLPAHLLARFPSKEKVHKHPPEIFIDPCENVWMVLPERKPFGEDHYREMYRINGNGERIEMRITQNWLDKLKKAREIHLRGQQNPRGNRR